MSSYHVSKFFKALESVGPEKFVEIVTQLSAAIDGGSLPVGTVTASALVVSGSDGTSKVALMNNTSYTPSDGEYSLFFEGGVLKAAVNGVKKTVTVT